MLKLRKKSGWKFESSSSIGLSIKAVGGGKGSFNMRSPDRGTFTFNYWIAGGGAGIGLPGKAGAFSFSDPTSNSTTLETGALWMTQVFKGDELEPTDLCGGCIVGEISAGGPLNSMFGNGVSGTFTILGIPELKMQNEFYSDVAQLAMHAAVHPSVVDLVTSKWELFESYAKAVLFMAGTTSGYNFGAGIMGYLGHVSLEAAKPQPIPRIDADIKFHEPLSFKSSSTARDTLAFIEIPGDVLFDFDKYVLKPTALQVLHKAGAALRPHQGRPVSIFGYTDSIGSNHYNDGLSEKRARAVMQWLVSNRYVNPAKVTIQGHGEKFPVAPNNTSAGRDNPEGRARNRRVEIIVWRS
jgi:outer membrane protein OmpA-like peptidoglycan-associated protein